MHLPSCLAARFIRGGDEPLAMRIVPEEVLPLVTALHPVINGSRVFDAAMARHSGRLSQLIKSVNREDACPESQIGSKKREFT
jgi:hypothetical protein